MCLPGPTGRRSEPVPSSPSARFPRNRLGQLLQQPVMTGQTGDFFPAVAAAVTVRVYSAIVLTKSSGRANLRNTIFAPVTSDHFAVRALGRPRLGRREGRHVCAHSPESLYPTRSGCGIRTTPGVHEPGHHTESRSGRLTAMRIRLPRMLWPERPAWRREKRSSLIPANYLWVLRSCGNSGESTAC